MGLFDSWAKKKARRAVAKRGRAIQEEYARNRREAEARRAQSESQVVVELAQPDAAHEQERKAREDRHESEQKEFHKGQLLRARALADAGVDLEQFSEQAALNDARLLLGRFAPEYRKLRVELGGAKVNIIAQNLTKAGKVPKNVIEAQIDANGGMAGIGDCIIGYLKYMADGSINMADFHLWHEWVKHSVYIRTGKQEPHIASIEYYDAKRDFRKLLFSEKESFQGVAAEEILSRSLGNILS